jgi:hypothetical protein
VNWIEEWKQNCRDMKDYVYELERRHEVAVQALADLSRGIGVKPEFQNYDWHDAMKNKASIELVKITKMPLRKKPYLRTY